MSEHNHRPDLRMADCEACVADPTPEPLTAEDVLAAAIKTAAMLRTESVTIPAPYARTLLATLAAARPSGDERFNTVRQEVHEAVFGDAARDRPGLVVCGNCGATIDIPTAAAGEGRWPRWECSACTRNANQCDASPDGRCCANCNHDRESAAGEGR